MITLYDYQLEAIEHLKTGSILCGGVGSGKSLTALGYFVWKECGGSNCKEGVYRKMIFPRDLYIITTAKKRDSLEWEKECAKFAVSDQVKVTIDSWNNIKKYTGIYEAFFIFDEQRVVGSGAWVKAFLNITRKNHWILLSATPGDQWTDYVPVFVANGYFRNKTEFNNRHCVYSRYSKYPKIERYLGEKELRKMRDSILVTMRDERKTERIEHIIFCEYDKDLYKTVYMLRWDPYEECPIQECGKWYYLQRRVVNESEDRLRKLEEILDERKRVIVFYNFDYELYLLKNFLEETNRYYKEWNGHRHEECPDSTYQEWVYLVQYTAGCEGWNCIISDTIIFFSQSYSYRAMEQAAGRIDRINTPFRKLFYYYFRSTAFIDMSIAKKIKNKKNFNEDRKLWERMCMKDDKNKRTNGE